MRLTEVSRQLIDAVEIDDTNLGGERSGGKACMGSENMRDMDGQTSSEGT